jgi:hypothetical protein
MTKIARIFPRKTAASPNDDLAFFGMPPEGISVDEAHISVTYTEDINYAGELFSEWDKITKIKFGGPALGDPGGDFTPGMYLKPGYVITSRGCPNDCWFCDVNKREGGIRELPITEGNNLLDSNILACSNKHIEAVFKMLKSQNKRPQLTGGLEARILTDYHVSLLWDLRPDQMFFAYDTLDDLEPLIVAGEKLRYADFTRRHLRCYVLIGFQGDTMTKALKRLIQTWKAGFLPMAMLYKNDDYTPDEEWNKFQRVWARPAITKSEVKTLWQSTVAE